MTMNYKFYLSPFLKIIRLDDIESQKFNFSCENPVQCPEFPDCLSVFHDHDERNQSDKNLKK